MHSYVSGIAVATNAHERDRPKYLNQVQFVKAVLLVMIIATYWVVVFQHFLILTPLDKTPTVQLYCKIEFEWKILHSVIVMKQQSKSIHREQHLPCGESY